MVFYGLAILSGTILTVLLFKQNVSRGRVLFLSGTVLFFLLGAFQRRNLPAEAVFLRYLSKLLALLLDIAPFVIGGFSLAIVYHSFRRLKKYGWTRKYAFLFLIASSLLFLLLLVTMNHLWLKKSIFYTLEFLLGIFFLYLFVTFLGFVVLAFLYRFIRPGLDKDYLIILGAGLLPNGMISSLLRYRLDEALRFYKEQMDKGKKPAQMIVSGGKGPDEPFSEAEAMKGYLVGKGVPAERVWTEEDSVNTHQNFLYSKKLIDAAGNCGEILFITNSFHMLRSGLYARQAGVEAEGLGAKTPIHYLPYALVREYLATMLIYRMCHFYALIVILAAALIFFR